MKHIATDLLSTVIGDIYAAAHDSSRWVHAVGRLRTVFDGSKACLARIGPDLGSGDSISTDTDDYFTRLFINDMVQAALPLGAAISRMPLGTVYSDGELMGEGRLKKTRFWNEWMEPQDMYGGLGCRLISSGTSCWMFDVQRGRRQSAFDAGERELLTLLMQHMRQALLLSRRQRLEGARGSGLDQLRFGMLLVDAKMRIQSANLAAETILDRPASPLRRRDGRLCVTSTSGDGDTLRRLVSGVCAMGRATMEVQGGELVLRTDRNDGVAGALVLSVAPLGHAEGSRLPLEPLAVVALRETVLASPPGFEARIKLLYGLSPKETRIAALLAEGLALKDAADTEGIAMSTARSYLDAVFAKTGTRRQGQLIAALKSAEPILITVG